VRLTADGASAAEQTVNGLEAGQEQEVSFADVQLKKGDRKLTATADPAKSVAELKDDNNDRTVTAVCGGGS
jgi:subtilase family serine protease